MSHDIISTNRRGMLLLMVMLMLALFMAIGATLLTIASRARAAARASMAATQQSALSDTMAKDVLDKALSAALRGATSGTNGSVTITGSVTTFGTATFIGTGPGSVLGSTGATGTSSPVFENLLFDKYGPQITATASITAGSTTPVMTLSLTSLSSYAGQPTALNGRILTIRPAAGVGDIASYRILGASGTSGTTTCFVPQMPSTVLRTLPALNVSFPVVINGREFTPLGSGTTTPEAYDGYDNANDWLAQPELANGQVTNYRRLSYGSTSGSTPWIVFVSGTPYLLSPSTTTATVDNDNDGILDGAWIPPDAVIASAKLSGSSTPFPHVLADQPSPLGGTLRFQVSYLILDLDGRINVNTAGMATAQSVYTGTPNTPIGMGYGPADINPQLLFPPNLPNSSGTYATSLHWSNLLSSGTPTTTPQNPSPNQRRTPPVIGRIDGRYGAGGPGAGSLPGISGDDIAGNQQTSAATYTLTIAGSNSVADLKAQTRTYMTAPSAGQITPTINFYRPTWSGSAGADAIDDPYESRHDADAPRGSIVRRPTVSGTTNDDNPLSLAELEPVLRPNDPDSPQLPQRLASGLEDVAQRSRTTITTDSWDTPGLTGLAARKIEDFLASPSLFPALIYTGSTWITGTNNVTANPVSPDIAAGLRFNINRPITSGTAAYEFCKDLYCLVLILGETNAQQAAQWAVNVLDFRDADSVMSGFEYDTNIANGWNVDGDLGTTSDADRAVVWGAERPELLIVETAAWRQTPTVTTPTGTSQLFVTLHQPATVALLTTATSGTTTISGTTEKSAFADAAGTINLSQTHDGTNSGSAIWQLRFNSTKTVQFLNFSAAPYSGTPPANVVGSSLATTPITISANGYLCVESASPQRFSRTVPGFPIDIGGAFQFPFANASGTVRLERLANPTLAFSMTTNPYVPVDTAILNNIPDASLVTVFNKNRRTGPQDLPPTPPASSAHSVFWKQPVPWETVGTGTTLSPYVISGTYTGTTVTTGTAPAPWFHWPNRPFISQAELALVPTGSSSTDGMLANYSFPTNSLVNSANLIVVSSTTAPLGSLILDATFVPSRFAENAITITGSSINTFGLNKFPSQHFSKWREPGRVNINTIVSGSTTPTDNVVWTTLTSNTGPPNPFNAVTSGTSTPAQSVAQLLSLSGSAGQQISTQTFTSGSTFNPQDKNPMLSYAQAIRLANTATVRSNVFAIWITVRITDDSTNAPSPVTKRVFAIIDRSIPVGYSPNQDLNVRDTIRLKRYLD